MIEKIQQLGDLREWEPCGSGWNKSDSWSGGDNKVSNKEMFAALLKDRMMRENIDGIPTNEMWRIYKQRGLNKPNKKVQSSQLKIRAQKM